VYERANAATREQSMPVTLFARAPQVDRPNATTPSLQVQTVLEAAPTH
jgi:hypothetical protein